MVEGVEGCLHYTAYFFSVLRTFAVCSAPIRGCRVSGERWMGPDFGDKGAGKLPALHESLGTSVGFRFKR